MYSTGVEGERRIPTHASIYHARSIRVYSNAVFPKIGSFQRTLSSTNPTGTMNHGEKSPGVVGNGVPAA